MCAAAPRRSADGSGGGSAGLGGPRPEGIHRRKGSTRPAACCPGSIASRRLRPSFLPVSLRERIGLARRQQRWWSMSLMSTLFDAIQSGPACVPRATMMTGTGCCARSPTAPSCGCCTRDGRTAAAAQNTAIGRQPRSRARCRSSRARPREGFRQRLRHEHGFSLERSIFSSGTHGFQGNVGYGGGSPTAVLRASFSHRMGNGRSRKWRSLPALTPPDLEINQRNASLQALSLSTSDDFTLGDVVELKLGSELQTIQFMGRVNAFRPFGSADLHLSPGYRAGISPTPPRSQTAGRKRALIPRLADLSESGPRMTMAGFAPAWSGPAIRKFPFPTAWDETNLQVAAYSDQPNRSGAHRRGRGGGRWRRSLPDPYSGTFSYQGKDLDAHGTAGGSAAQNDLGSHGHAGLWLRRRARPGKQDVSLEDARQQSDLRNRQSRGRQSSAGTVPGSKTRWIASYRWVQRTAR